MAASEKHSNNVIRRDQVRLVGQAAMLDCGPIADGRSGQPIGIVPLMDGDRVAGFEVRCGCGASAIVECIYETPGPAPDRPISESPPAEAP